MQQFSLEILPNHIVKKKYTLLKNIMIASDTKHQGFTMVELLIVITIFVVLTAIGVPSLVKWLPQYRLKAATRNLYSDMQKARLTAIKEDLNIGLTFTPVAYPVEGGGYEVFTDENGNALKDSGEEVRMTRTMDKQVSLVSSGFAFGLTSFSFNPKGVLTRSNQGSVVLRNADRQYKITVSASGGMRVETSSY